MKTSRLALVVGCFLGTLVADAAPCPAPAPRSTAALEDSAKRDEELANGYEGAATACSKDGPACGVARTACGDLLNAALQAQMRADESDFLTDMRTTVGGEIYTPTATLPRSVPPSAQGCVGDMFAIKAAVDARRQMASRKTVIAQEYKRFLAWLPVAQARCNAPPAQPAPVVVAPPAPGAAPGAGPATPAAQAPAAQTPVAPAPAAQPPVVQAPVAPSGGQPAPAAVAPSSDAVAGAAATTAAATAASLAAAQRAEAAKAAASRAGAEAARAQADADAQAKIAAQTQSAEAAKKAEALKKEAMLKLEEKRYAELAAKKAAQAAQRKTEAQSENAEAQAEQQASQQEVDAREQAKAEAKKKGDEIRARMKSDKAAAEVRHNKRLGAIRADPTITSDERSTLIDQENDAFDGEIARIEQQGAAEIEGVGDEYVAERSSGSVDLAVMSGFLSVGEAAASGQGVPVGGQASIRQGIWFLAPAAGLSSGFELRALATFFAGFGAGKITLLHVQPELRFWWGRVGIGAAFEWKRTWTDLSTGPTFLNDFGLGPTLSLALFDSQKFRAIVTGRWMPILTGVDNLAAEVDLAFGVVVLRASVATVRGVNPANGQSRGGVYLGASIGARARW